MKDHDVDDSQSVSIHVSPSYPAGCVHEWAYTRTHDESGRIIDEEPSHCIKCGISFTRYIFTECP